MRFDLYDIYYLRLSKEDGDVTDGTETESCSIHSQRTCIHHYIQSMGMDPMSFKEIVDDGYSGTNMNRPGAKELIDLVFRGRVRTIIVRDLSRFARNYLDAGRYLELVFPTYGVRFISINDRFDSAKVGEDTGGLELAIRNLLNQLYSKDISKKIKSAVDMKKYSGEFVYGTAPFGYKKGPKKNTIVIDPEASIIVKNIFKWASEGVTITQIAQRLNEQGVTTPSVYLAAIRGKYKTRSVWTYESVRNILQNRIYTGDTVPFKSHVVKVGSNRTKAVPLSQQEIIPNTHAPIISRELFEQATNARKRYAARVYDPEREAYVFTSLLVCGCCGNRLIRGKAQNKDWRCTMHRYDQNAACKDVRFKDALLTGIVYHAIKTQCDLLDLKIKKVKADKRAAVTKEQMIRDECRRLQAQLDGVRKEKREAYERYVSGALSKEGFMTLKSALTAQEENIKLTLSVSEAKLNEIVEQLRQSIDQVASAYTMVTYHDITQLTPALAQELIEKIVIFPEGRIRIHWNYTNTLAQMLEREKIEDIRIAV